MSTKMLSESGAAERLSHGHMRRMGHLENYFALLQRQELYANFIIGCRLSRGLTPGELAGALRAVVLANPILAHTMVPPEGVTDLKKWYTSQEYLGKPRPEHDYMAVLERLRLEDVVLNEQEEYRNLVEKAEVQFSLDGGEITPALSELLSAITIPAYDPERPNWRLLCLGGGGSGKSNTLVFISNHCCADAMTGINLFTDIARAVNKNSGPNDQEKEDKLILDYSQDQANLPPLPRPITERVDYVPSLLTFIWLLITTLFNGFVNFKTETPLTCHVSREEPQECFQQFVRLSPEELAEVRTRVREQGCTMTAMLQAALCITLRDHGVFQGRPLQQQSFDVTVPNDTRRLLAPELAEEQYRYGANVGGLHYSYLIGSFQREKFWDLARYYTGVLRNGDYLVGLGSLMMDMVTGSQNIDAMIADSYLNKRRGGIILSNVGVIAEAESNNPQALRIEDLLFAQNLGVLNFSYAVNVVTTPAGGMALCMSAVQGSVRDRSDLDAIAAELKQLVLSQAQA